MIALILCALAFSLAFRAGRSSLASGLVVVLGVGYAYGILRANVEQTAAHFLFDAAVLGLYLAQITHPSRVREPLRLQSLKNWLIVLIAWPLLLFLLPIQDPLVQLVGLRGNMFLLPFLLFGAKLTDEDLKRLTFWLAAFNLAAFGFAGAEYFLGIERFFPYSAVTDIIYRSNDLVGYTAYRIPATFASSHSYAGTMVVTLPLLLGTWIGGRSPGWRSWVLAGGIIAALLGVFLSAARTHFVVLVLLLATATLSGELKRETRIGWALILLAVGWVVSGEQRLQRFMSLENTEYVTDRVAGSVNKRFFQLVAEYPLGNGLGGGGTSVPYFLQDRLRNPVSLENEYARIVAEEGLAGLALWLGFLAWVFTRPHIRSSEPWGLGRRLARLAALAYFGTGLIGVGLFTSVPQTCLLLLLVGWSAVRRPREAEAPEASAREEPARDAGREAALAGGAL